MKKRITVLIADDHPIFRRGLAEVLHEDTDFDLVGEAGEGMTALRQIRELKPNVAVVDLDMPELNGLELARRIFETESPTAIAVLTMHKEERIFDEAINMGVKGYVLKENAAVDILNCIRAVAAGEAFISPSLSTFLLSRRTRTKAFFAEKPALNSLTAAESRVLKLIAEDFTSKEIGERLGISVHTVENHRANICNKLEIHGSHSLLKFAYDNKDRL